MSETEITHEAVEEEQEDAEYYHEWRGEDGTIRSSGWTPLLAVDHDGLTEWQNACRDAIKASIDVEDHEGEVVFKTWAFREEVGVEYEALVDGIEDPEVSE